TRSQFHNSGQNKLLLEGAATFDRCLFDGGDGLFSAGTGSITHVTKSVVSNQLGPDGAHQGGGFLSGGPGARAGACSSGIKSVRKCGTGSLACLGGSAGGSCTDNSIIFNTANTAPTDTVQGTACDVNYSLVLPQSTTLTGANNKLGLDPLMKDPDSADYHL